MCELLLLPRRNIQFDTLSRIVIVRVTDGDREPSTWYRRVGYIEFLSGIAIATFAQPRCTSAHRFRDRSLHLQYTVTDLSPLIVLRRVLFLLTSSANVRTKICSEDARQLPGGIPDRLRIPRSRSRIGRNSRPLRALPSESVREQSDLSHARARDFPQRVRLRSRNFAKLGLLATGMLDEY